MKTSEFSGSTPKDPVCGMEADPKSPFRTTYEGQDYFFCSSHCLFLLISITCTQGFICNRFAYSGCI